MNNYGFDIIKRKNDGQVAVLIFENEYKKEDVTYEVNRINKSFKIIYTDGEIFFEEIEDNILNLLKGLSLILITEFNVDNNKSSSGKPVNVYEAYYK
jgi:predicted ribosome-associated RNA-binding protein Tma20